MMVRLLVSLCYYGLLNVDTGTDITTLTLHSSVSTGTHCYHWHRHTHWCTGDLVRWSWHCIIVTLTLHCGAISDTLHPCLATPMMSAMVHGAVPVLWVGVSDWGGQSSLRWQLLWCCTPGPMTRLPLTSTTLATSHPTLTTTDRGRDGDQVDDQWHHHCHPDMIIIWWLINQFWQHQWHIGHPITDNSLLLSYNHHLASNIQMCSYLAHSLSLSLQVSKQSDNILKD